MPEPGLTIAQKILARTSGVAHPRPGQVVEAMPDFSYSHDFAVYAIDAFERMGATRVLRPDRVAICLDHIVPADNARDANNHARIRAFAKAQRRAHFFDGGTGIPYHVRRGGRRPGQPRVASDSIRRRAARSGLALGVGRDRAGFAWARDAVGEVPSTVAPWTARCRPGFMPRT